MKRYFFTMLCNQGHHLKLISKLLNQSAEPIPVCVYVGVISTVEDKAVLFFYCCPNNHTPFVDNQNQPAFTAD